MPAGGTLTAAPLHSETGEPSATDFDRNDVTCVSNESRGDHAWLDAIIESGVGSEGLHRMHCAGWRARCSEYIAWCETACCTV